VQIYSINPNSGFHALASKIRIADYKILVMSSSEDCFYATIVVTKITNDGECIREKDGAEAEADDELKGITGILSCRSDPTQPPSATP
jgi:hypothetical protein